MKSMSPACGIDERTPCEANAVRVRSPSVRKAKAVKPVRAVSRLWLHTDKRDVPGGPAAMKKMGTMRGSDG